ncbi:MAG TPA: deoxyribonuclease V [Candidatus Ozemobacteraceae bacterium]|nr:deoxyribonuclease V [Candidatus Ozemobacteraceae bacterium]
MNLKPLHVWNVSPTRAMGLQERLVGSIIPRGRPRGRLVAGIDCSFEHEPGGSVNQGTIVAAIIVWECASGKVVDEAFAVLPAAFPYVPGLLTFREGPAVLEAWGRLKTKPDVVIFDGHGIAHPRGIGIASHLGLWLDLPSIGCAKSRLCGEATDPAPEAGSVSDLRLDGRLIGRLVRTKTGVKPVFVSIGHRIGLTAAVDLVLACCRGYRLPEPTRLAHLAGNRFRREQVTASTTPRR